MSSPIITRIVEQVNDLPNNLQQQILWSAEHDHHSRSTPKCQGTNL